MSGYSAGGSMAFRFMCEKSEMIAGLVINGQAWFDPYVGINNGKGTIPVGEPKCKPAYKRPFFSTIGTTDMYYGGNGATAGMGGFKNW